MRCVLLICDLLVGIAHHHLQAKIIFMGDRVAGQQSDEASEDKFLHEGILEGVFSTFILKASYSTVFAFVKILPGLVVFHQIVS